MTTPGGELRATVERVTRQAETVRAAAREAADKALGRATQESEQAGGNDGGASRPRE